MNQAVAARRKIRKTKLSDSLDARVLTSILSRNMKTTSAVEGRTKRAAARLAIVAAIRAGDLQPGDVLPSEKSLTIILGVSLGTVQAALRQLQEIGVVVRRRGDGSKIGSVEPLTSAVWHFRFAAKSDGTPLRKRDEKAWIDTITETGDWSEFIGDCDTYLRIRRRLQMQNGTRVGAEMFIRTTIAPGLENISQNELGMTSIRPYLDEKYGIVTTGATHIVKTVSIDTETAKIFGLLSCENLFEIQAKAYSHDHSPTYFQRIYISADESVLNF